MSAKPNEQVFDQAFDPFRASFQPEERAKGKSHFQSAFVIVRSARRRQALGDLYSYCRLVDDISDDENLHLSIDARLSALEKIAAWVQNPSPTQNPFWNRFAAVIHEFNLSTPALLGVIEGVKIDLRHKPLFILTWNELNTYVHGVAGCVGELVLNILGLSSPVAQTYAENLGRCLQYLNIMRDLDEDFKSGRIYVPREALSEWGATAAEQEKRERWTPELKKRVRAELYSRALEARRLAKPFSIRCFIPEAIAALYLDAAKKYWQHGDSRRLTTAEKTWSITKAIFRSLY